MSAQSPEPGSSSERAGYDSPRIRARRRDLARLRAAVEHSRDLVFVISLSGVVQYVSPNAGSVLGYAPGELAGSTLFEWIHPDDVDPVKRGPGSGRPRLRWRQCHKNGTWRHLELADDCLGAEGPDSRLIVVHDVTAEREAIAECEHLAAELVRAEKLTALGALAAGAAHDLNNILTAIIIHAELARGRAENPAMRDGLEQILKTAEHAKALAKQVLDFSTPQKHARTPVRLAVVAREVLLLLRPILPANIELVSELSDDTGLIPANATQLHQVLINLCQNAAHAIGERPGRLVVQVAGLEVDDALARAHRGLRRGPHVSLSVIDTGHGMDVAT